MIVSLVSNKQILTAVSSSTSKSRNEELLTFGCQSITGLLAKVLDNTDVSVNQALIEKIFAMMMEIQSKKVREEFSIRLRDALNNSKVRHLVSENALNITVELNSLKRGLADLEFNYDRVLPAIK